MGLKSLSFLSALVLGLILSFPGMLQAETDKNKQLHTIHMMMNHGLTMILDGSSLIMMAEMDIDTTVVKDPLVHGNKMIAKGKSLIDRAIRGPVMVEKHMQETRTTKMMDLTHQLGELMLKTAYAHDIMQPAMKGSEVAINLHVLHLEASHALIMAAQGSNMVMIGQSGMNNDLTRFSIEQGRKMMSEARTILIDLLTGKTVKDLEKRKLSPADLAMFNHTKELLIVSVDIANLLFQMEFE